MRAKDPGSAQAGERLHDGLDAPVSPDRMIALSDAVIAVIITIMVLQFVVPKGHAIADLAPLAPTLFAYALSFTFVGTYWMTSPTAG